VEHYGLFLCLKYLTETAMEETGAQEAKGYRKWPGILTPGRVVKRSFFSNTRYR
jgi:hypothetical protein